MYLNRKAKIFKSNDAKMFQTWNSAADLIEDVLQVLEIGFPFQWCVT